MQSTIINENRHRKVWRLAGPIILANVSVPMLGVVDTAVMGHLPEAWYIGAVAVGAMIFSYVYWGFGFLRMGTTGLVAQAYGANDTVEIRALLGRALLLALVLGIVIFALQWPLISGALWFIEASDKVETLAHSYFDIRVFAAPAALANYAVLGWLLGLQRAKSALMLQIFMNGVNIVLDLWFVLGLGWGVEGVALATAISEYAAAGLGIVLALRVLGQIGGQWSLDRLIDPLQLKRLFVVNGDIFVRTLCLVTAFAYFTSRGASMGDTLLAANAILMNFQMIVGYALDGFAFAAEALIGAAIGAKDRAKLIEAVRISTIWAGIFAGLFSAVYAVAGTLIINGMTDIGTVRETARTFLIWAVLSPLVSVWSFQLDGIFIGATRTRAMRNGMAISLASFLLGVWIMVPLWGNHGLWAAFYIYMIMRAVTLVVRYPALLRSVPEAVQEARQDATICK
ncbi:MAG: MATE family efflux transporter [Alphaproteobacteria bacterium]|jgi:multidrug resistance protein, MATE family|nr:MATE family efflux transporter [Alphaproteobacteria bacterium]MBT4016532.1 MATE family efflux transporter [Alphaproteobacteria bacterium]MBT4967183.1 MATE family efflux transporter [Alphaproteobacteria bacterium]MBT5160049.1 MATE family efflux transporter [Alphaproteobacteria bacterium]MBT5918699.1 MATE family efflux transporter [Alphaproteobacteria bacterium]